MKSKQALKRKQAKAQKRKNHEAQKRKDKAQHAANLARAGTAFQRVSSPRSGAAFDHAQQLCRSPLASGIAPAWTHGDYTEIDEEEGSLLLYSKDLLNHCMLMGPNGSYVYARTTEGLFRWQLTDEDDDLGDEGDFAEDFDEDEDDVDDEALDDEDDVDDEALDGGSEAPITGVQPRTRPPS